MSQLHREQKFILFTKCDESSIEMLNIVSLPSIRSKELFMPHLYSLCLLPLALQLFPCLHPEARTAELGEQED